MKSVKTISIAALILGLGLIGMIVSLVSEIYSTSVGIVIMLAVWLIGGGILGLQSSRKDNHQAPPLD
jgi:hypothetical protein